MKDSAQVLAIAQLPTIVEIELETESDDAWLMDEDVPSDSDLVDAYIDYDEPISQDILSEDLVGFVLDPRGDDNQVIELTSELAKVKEEL